MIAQFVMESKKNRLPHATLRSAGQGTPELPPDAQVDEMECSETDHNSKSCTSCRQREEPHGQMFFSFKEVHTNSCVRSLDFMSLDDCCSVCACRPPTACRLASNNSAGRCKCSRSPAEHSDQKCDTSRCIYLCNLACDHNVSSSLGDQSNLLPKLGYRVDSGRSVQSNNEKDRHKPYKMNVPTPSLDRQKPVRSCYQNSERRRLLSCSTYLESIVREQIVSTKKTCPGRASSKTRKALGAQKLSHVTSAWLCKALSAFVVLMTVMLPGAVVHANPVYVPMPRSSVTLSPVRESLWLGHTRKLDIRRTPCRSSSAEVGVCMFNFECLQRAGDLIGTCMDGFLFGVCCKLSDLNLEGASQSMNSSADVESPMIVPNVDNKLQLDSTNKKPTPSSTITRISYVTKPSNHTLLFTKTKPNNSVLLYAADSVTKRPFVAANLQNSKESHFSKIYPKLPKPSERNSTFTTVLEVRSDLFSRANKTEISPFQSTNVTNHYVVVNPQSTEVEQNTNSIVVSNQENEIFQTTSRSSDSAFSSSHSDASTPESLLVWPLLPQSLSSSGESSTSSSTKFGFASMSPSSVSVSAFMTFPKFSVDSTTPLSPESSNVKPSSENYLGASFEKNIVDSTQASSLLVKAKPLGTLSSTTAETPTSTSWLDAYRVNISDPMAFWTTTRPSRRPALQPRPVSSTTEGETSEELVFWTTSKPSLRPRPWSKPVPTTEKEPITKTKISSLLLPVESDVDTSFKAEGLIEELIASMSNTLAKDETKISNNTPIFTTPSSNDPWVSSTFPILPLEIDIAENTIDVDSNVVKTSSSTPAPQSSTISTQKVQPTTVSTVVSSPVTGTLERPSVSTETNSDISGTTPIDEFIENLLNSLIMSNSSTAPPIDLDLIQQMLNGSDVGSVEDLNSAIASIASFANVSVNLIEDSDEQVFAPSSSSTTQASTSSTASFSAPLRTPTPTTTTTTTTTTSTTTTTRATTTSTPTTTTPTTSTYKSWNWRTTCGVRPLSRTGRIVNGEETAFGVWPWQVLVKESTWLGLFTKVKCGGVLLNERYVLTAAHCQPGFLGSLIVVLGDHDLSGDFEPAPAVERNVKRVVVHRGYIARTFDNDLALLELDRPVKLAEHILPICLPENDDDYVGQVGTVTGWGRLAYGGNIPKKLNEVRLPIVPNSECQSWFREAGHGKKIKPEFMCAGFKSGEKDSCEGDSGGPLTVRGPDGRWVLAGTVSHGIKCAYPNLPGVYMRMSYYKPWILKVMEG